ncbi:MAG TPA: hypothetical protein VKP04_08745 [Ktedonobacteraceae bacterium]|nr:hypothetical protein [Ktedonobacteraceae bacterium]
MSYILWTFMCFCAYVGGLVILVKITPLLLTRTYDEGYFMAIAAADVLGGMFVFGAVAITFGLFSGTFAIRLMDCFLLLGIAIVAFNLSYRCFRSRRAIKAHSVSRVIASGYSLLLGLAALFYLALLFVPGG